MSWWVIALVMGVVEGLTEFVPVSSTGHLIVAAKLLSFEGPAAKCFEVFIQLGAILAVVVLFRRRFAVLLKPVVGLPVIPSDLARAEGFRRQGQPGNAEVGFVGLRGWMLLALTTLPALIIGALAHSYIKQHLFSVTTVVWALFAGGVAILLAERFKPPARAACLDQLTWRQALAIGLFQCLSMWPGVSRAAATIVGGMLVGLDRPTAAQYSFLAAVPVMFAATGYDLYKSWSFLSVSYLPLFLMGFVVSFVAAAAAVQTFIRILQRWTLRPFALYRLAASPVFYLLAG